MSLERRFARTKLKEALKERDFQNALAESYNKGYDKGSREGQNVGRARRAAEIVTAGFHLEYTP